MSIRDVEIEGRTVRLDMEAEDAGWKSIIAQVEDTIRGLRCHCPQETSGLTLYTIAALTLCARLDHVEKAASQREIVGQDTEYYLRLFLGTDPPAGYVPGPGVVVTIDKRHIRVQMPGLKPEELERLATCVDRRMRELSEENPGIADSQKLALVACFDFALRIKNATEALELAAPLGSAASRLSTIAGQIIELGAPLSGEKYFRALLWRQRGAPVRLLIPIALISPICKEFVAGKRVSLKGRMVAAGEQGSFSVVNHGGA